MTERTPFERGASSHACVPHCRGDPPGIPAFRHSVISSFRHSRHSVIGSPRAGRDPALPHRGGAFCARRPQSEADSQRPKADSRLQTSDSRLLHGQTCPRGVRSLWARSAGDAPAGAPALPEGAGRDAVRFLEAARASRRRPADNGAPGRAVDRRPDSDVRSSALAATYRSTARAAESRRVRRAGDAGYRVCRARACPGQGESEARRHTAQAANVASVDDDLPSRACDGPTVQTWLAVGRRSRFGSW